MQSTSFMYAAFLALSITVMSTQGSSNCQQCHGLFCGRPTNTSDCAGTCGVCPRGYRTNSYYCTKCEALLKLYDWLFLGFILICVVVSNFYAIDMFHARGRKSWLYPLSVILESFISFMLMVLTFEPRGELVLYSCGVKSIKDWYTFFYNPKPDYVNVVRCTQEAVYPLYTSIFMYLLYNLVLMVLLRGCILPYITKEKSLKSLYAGLYIIPLVGVLHTCLAGVIYYVYPYLMIVLSVFGVALFLSTLDQNFTKNLKKTKTFGCFSMLLCSTWVWHYFYNRNESASSGRPCSYVSIFTSFILCNFKEIYKRRKI